MNLLIKKIFKILIGIIFLLLISGIIISISFGERIEQLITQKIQNQISSEIKLSEVNFDLYTKFPSGAVHIKDFLVFEKEGFHNDTLFYSKKISIEISMSDILLNNIEIHKVIISDSKLNIKYDINKNSNFSIFKTTENNTLARTNLLFLNSTLKYKSKATDLHFNINEAKILLKENQAEVTSTFSSKKLMVLNKDYLGEKDVTLDANIELKEDGILIHEPSKIRIGKANINCSGEILKKNTINLNVSCESQEIEDLMNITPTHLKSIYRSFYANGEISCVGNIAGKINKINNPKTTIHYSIKKGSLRIKSKEIELTNMYLDGNITNGEEKNFKTTKINVSKFNCDTKKGSIEGQFILQNLNNPFLTTTLNSNWILSEFSTYFSSTPLLDLEGYVTANTKYSGNISFKKNITNLLLSKEHNSDITLKNVQFKYNQLPFNIKLATGRLNIDIINITESAFTISDSDLRFQGDISNLIHYILNKNPKITVNGGISSTYIRLEELLNLTSKKDATITDKEEISKTIPDWIKINLNTDIKNFSYNNFTASNITGGLSYENLTLTGDHISFNSLNGNVLSDFKFYKSNSNTFKLFSQTNVKKINIRNTFLTFNNFNQTFITAEHIKGESTAEIQMRASWDNDFNFIKEDLDVKSHLIIEKGELIKFKPLENLSDYISIDDLKTVQFSTLENTIEIGDNIVTIPNMEIKSSALSVFISGTHTFAQKVDYRIKLLLSELMSTRFRNKNTKIKETEFGEMQKESEIFNTIYFKMTGEADDPDISFDRIRFREDIQKGLNKEKEIITNIIKEDILKTEEKEKLEKGQDVIIEWDEK